VLARLDKRARLAITIIIELSPQLMTCKLIKEKIVTERFSEALHEEFSGLY